MALKETEGFLLSAISHGDTSKIVRFFTKDYGKLSLIAKGVKKSKNKSGGALDSLNLLKLVYYHKDSRELQLLSKFEIINIFPGIKCDLNKLAFGMAMLETIVNLVVEEEANMELFRLIENAFNALETGSNNLLNIYWYFLLRFLKISGYEIVLDNCRSCGGNENFDSPGFSYTIGGIICENCKDIQETESISRESLDVLKNLQANEPEGFVNLQVSDSSAFEINNILKKYFTFHFDGYRTPESLKLII
jgi:DNA repair protein RecO (recombination protein O)